MSMTVPIALFGWPIVTILLFSRLAPRRAVLAAFILGWLFLPMASYSVTGLPGGWSKLNAIVLSTLVCIVLFDAPRLRTFRWGALDLPMLVWCVVPLASSVSNGLGLYDGMAAMAGQVLSWGLPYFIGRIYFSDSEGLKELAVAVFIGGLVYLPFCLWELRMSPRLHNIIYGFHQHSFSQHIRFDGWRPKVFMQHGLMVGMWMAGAAVAGFWLWRTRTIAKIWGMPVALPATALIATAALTKAAGAITLGLVAVLAFWLTKKTTSRALVILLLIAPLSYMGLRASGTWSGQHLLDTASALPMLDERAHSLRYRLDTENVLIEHAMRQPVFGWGLWGRHRPGRMGYAVTDYAPDGAWVNALGRHGIVGLVSFAGVLLLPVWLFIRRYPAKAWSDPATVPAAIIAMLLLLYMIDSLFNEMPNPLYVIAAGALSAWVRANPGVRVGVPTRGQGRSIEVPLAPSHNPRHGRIGAPSHGIAAARRP